MNGVCGNRHVDGLVQNCSIPIALAMEILQSCTKPFISYLHGNVITNTACEHFSDSLNAPRAGISKLSVTAVN